MESVIQVGIRTLNQVQQSQIDRYGSRIHILEARKLGQKAAFAEHIKDEVPVYVSVDMDAFDPAHAPGVSHPVPGGLSPRQVLNLFHEANWKLVGMDAVEVNPLRDINNLTAILAARILHEGMAHAWKQAFLETHPMKVWGSRQWFIASVHNLCARGYRVNVHHKWLSKGWLIWEHPDIL